MFIFWILLIQATTESPALQTKTLLWFLRAIFYLITHSTVISLSPSHRWLNWSIKIEKLSAIASPFTKIRIGWISFHQTNFFNIWESILQDLRELLNLFRDTRKSANSSHLLLFKSRYYNIPYLYNICAMSDFAMYLFILHT